MHRFLLPAAAAVVGFFALNAQAADIQLAQSMSYQGCTRTMPGDSSPCENKNAPSAMSYQGCKRTMPGDSSPCEVESGQGKMSYQGCTRTMPGDSSPCEVKKQ